MKNKWIVWSLLDMGKDIAESQGRRIENAHVHLNEPLGTLVLASEFPQVQRCRSGGIRHPNEVDAVNIRTRDSLPFPLIPQVKDSSHTQFSHQGYLSLVRDIREIPRAVNIASAQARAMAQVSKIGDAGEGDKRRQRDDLGQGSLGNGGFQIGVQYIQKSLRVDHCSGECVARKQMNNDRKCVIGLDRGW